MSDELPIFEVTHKQRNGTNPETRLLDGYKKASVLRFIAENDYTIERVSPSRLIALTKAGVEVEHVK
jgi:hypothetical protein